MEVVVLGSAGWFPRPERQTTCVCVRTPSTLCLFDVGSGLARLAQPEYAWLLQGDFEVAVFLTHLHLDHIVGVTYLAALFPGRRTTLFVPDVRRAGDGPVWLQRLVRPPFFPHTLSEFPLPLQLKRAQLGAVSIGECEVTARLQRHPGGSLGYRLGDALVVLTDCSPSEDAGAFAHGARVLIHEAWTALPDPAGTNPAPHSSAGEAAEVAAQGEVGELLLCHLHPLLAAGDLERVLTAARAVFPLTYLAEDGMRRSVRCSKAPSSLP